MCPGWTPTKCLALVPSWHWVPSTKKYGSKFRYVICTPRESIESIWELHWSRETIMAMPKKHSSFGFLFFPNMKLKRKEDWDVSAKQEIGTKWLNFAILGSDDTESISKSLPPYQWMVWHTQPTFCKHEEKAITAPKLKVLVLFCFDFSKFLSAYWDPFLRTWKNGKCLLMLVEGDQKSPVCLAFYWADYNKCTKKEWRREDWGVSWKRKDWDISNKHSCCWLLTSSIFFIVLWVWNSSSFLSCSSGICSQHSVNRKGSICHW